MFCSKCTKVSGKHFFFKATELNLKSKSSFPFSAELMLTLESIRDPTFETWQFWWQVCVVFFHLWFISSKQNLKILMYLIKTDVRVSWQFILDASKPREVYVTPQQTQNVILTEKVWLVMVNVAPLCSILQNVFRNGQKPMEVFKGVRPQDINKSFGLFDIRLLELFFL